MGTVAIIAGILSLLSTIGGIAGQALSKKADRENVNDFGQPTSNAGDGISIASDISGMAAQALSFADGFGSMFSKPNSTQIGISALKRSNALRAKSLGLAFNKSHL